MAAAMVAVFSCYLLYLHQGIFTFNNALNTPLEQQQQIHIVHRSSLDAITQSNILHEKKT